MRPRDLIALIFIDSGFRWTNGWTDQPTDQGCIKLISSPKVYIELYLTLRGGGSTLYIPANDRPTNGQTDRQTDRQTGGAERIQ